MLDAKNAALNAPMNNSTPDLGPTGATPNIPNDVILPGTTPESLRRVTVNSAKDLSSQEDAQQDSYKNIALQSYGKVKGFFKGVEQGAFKDIMESANIGMFHNLEATGFLDKGTAEKYIQQNLDEKAEYDNLSKAHNYYAGAGEFVGSMLGAGKVAKGVKTLKAMSGLTGTAEKIVPKLPGAIQKAAKFLSPSVEAGAVGGVMGMANPEAVAEDHEGTQFASSALTSGILGAAMKVATPAFKYGAMNIAPTSSKGLRLVANKISSAINAAGEAGEDIKSSMDDKDIDAAKFWYAAKKVGITGPEELQGATERAQQATNAGVGQLTAGALTRLPNVQKQESDLLDNSKRFQDVYNGITKNLYSASQKLVTAIGGIAKKPFNAAKDVQDFLTKNYHDAKDTISDAYDAIKDTDGANAPLPLNHLTDTLSFLKKQQLNPIYNEKIQGFLDEMQNRVNPRETEPGKLVNVAGQPLLQAGRTRIPKPTATVGELTGFITELNKYGRTLDTGNVKGDTIAAVNMLRDSTYKTLDTIADDQTNPANALFNAARTARLHLDDVFGQKDIVENAIKFKDRLTRVMPPEVLQRRIFGGTQPLENLNKIENALKYTSPTEEALKKGDVSASVNPDGVKLWDNIRASALQDIIRKSTKNINGENKIMPQSLIQDFRDREDVYKKLIPDKDTYKKYNDFIDTLDYWSNRSEGNILDGSDAIKKSAQEFQREALREGRYSGHHTLSNVISATIGFVHKIATSFNDSKKVASNLLVSRVLAQSKDIPSTKSFDAIQNTVRGLIRNVSASAVQPKQRQSDLDMSDSSQDNMENQ